MAVAAKIEVVMEDDLPAIGFVIRDKNNPVEGKTLDPRNFLTWRVVDLTGYQCRADIKVKGSEEVLESIVLVILDPEAGSVLMPVSGSLFMATADKYQVEIVTISGTNQQQTIYDIFEIDVRTRIKNKV